MTQIDNKTDCLGSVSAGRETTSKNINKMQSQSHPNAIWPQRIEIAAEYCQTMHKHTGTFDPHIVITHRHTDTPTYAIHSWQQHTKSICFVNIHASTTA